MPNIIINNYCNQKCPYCFAQNMMAGDNNDMKLGEFKKIFQWLKKSKCHQIGLIGGEPTLSPNLKSILNYINEEKETYPLRITIFTNGTNIEPFLNYLDNSYTLLININAPSYVGEKNNQNTLKGIELLSKKNEVNMNFGITLFENIQDMEYILKLAKRYHQNIIRVSYASPTDILLNKEEYYIKGKEIFYNFCLKCIEYNLKIQLDCNRIPQCYFSIPENNFIRFLTMNKKLINFCLPAIDIDKEGNATPCFGGRNGLKPKNIFNFENLTGLERNFYCTDMLNKALNNNDGKCSNCKKFQNLECQGGCLAFSNWKGE